jgi:putative ATP-dependent endonuclease of OLD family
MQQPGLGTDPFKFIYLPAWRHPLDELARRETRILIELLRAQQERLDGSRSLVPLRVKASRLLENLAKDGLIEAVEQRISTHLASLTSGVQRQWPYVRGQVIDDSYLARVLELMLAVVEGRTSARPLEVSGLGYVNLLHMAVTLAAIPDSAARAAAAGEASETSDEPGELTQADEEQLARERRVQAAAEAESEADSFFPRTPFHATVVSRSPKPTSTPSCSTPSCATCARPCASVRNCRSCSPATPPTSSLPATPNNWWCYGARQTDSASADRSPRSR